MTEPRSDREPAREPAARRADPHAGAVRYPENHVVAIVDTPEAAAAAVETLTSGGFLESEVTLACGARAADRLRASSGRSGLLGHVIQIADHLGVRTEELETRHQYEEALRDGRFVLTVLAPTEERKDRAAQILRDYGAHFINFKGRFTIEQLAP
jgi:hypothetical protein